MNIKPCNQDNAIKVVGFALEFSQEISEKKIFTTILNIAELKFGAYNSKKIKYNLSRIDEFKNNILNNSHAILLG